MFPSETKCINGKSCQSSKKCSNVNFRSLSEPFGASLPTLLPTIHTDDFTHPPLSEPAIVAYGSIQDGGGWSAKKAVLDSLIKIESLYISGTVNDMDFDTPTLVYNEDEYGRTPTNQKSIFIYEWLRNFEDNICRVSKVTSVIVGELFWNPTTFKQVHIVSCVNAYFCYTRQLLYSRHELRLFEKRNPFSRLERMGYECFLFK